jgi:ribosomal protein S18 acetylase RimI-like enzyme
LEIRRVREEEWAQLRELRLRALSADPGAFGSSAAEESAYSEKRWREMARGQVFVAIDDSRWVGMAGCFQEDDVMWVWGIWLVPSRRGKGVGRRLLDEAMKCALDQGSPHVRLSVTENNTAAETLYRDYGFVETGRRKPLRSDPSLVEVELERST